MLVCIASPSGGGKTTVCHKLLERHPDFEFSVSCTTRNPRHHETEGVDYHFLSREEFELRIRNGELAEYEEVHGHLYGTLKSTVDDALSSGRVLLVDIDVKGALRLKSSYDGQCLTIFLQPPDLEVLKDRLRQRNTESEQEYETRLRRIEMERTHGKQFDVEIINDSLEETVQEVEQEIQETRTRLTEDMNYGS